MQSKNQTVIRLSRRRTKEEIFLGFTIPLEKFISMEKFDYRKKWFTIDGLRWTNRGLAVGEIS